MAFAHKFSRSWSQQGLDPLTYEHTVTVGGGQPVSEPIPDGASDLAVNLAIDFSTLKGLFVASDREITIEVNQPGGGSGVPDQTWNLKANQPISWCEDDVMDCPLDADVTVIYVTNASGLIANLEIRAPQDVTP